MYPNILVLPLRRSSVFKPRLVNLHGRMITLISKPDTCTAFHCKIMDILSRQQISQHIHRNQIKFLSYFDYIPIHRGPFCKLRVSRIDPLFVSLVSLGHPRILFVVVFRHVSLPKSQNLIYSVWRCKNGTNLFSTQLFLCFNSPLFLVRRSPLQMQSWGSHLCPFVFCKSRLTNSIVQPFYVASRFRYVIR